MNSMGTSHRPDEQLARDFTRALRRALEATLGAKWKICNEFERDQEHPRIHRTFEMWKHAWERTWHAPLNDSDWRLWNDKICIGMTALKRGPNGEPGHFWTGIIKGPARPRNRTLRHCLEQRFGASRTSDEWWVWGVLVDERYRDWGNRDVEARLRQRDEALRYFTEYFTTLIDVAAPEIERELGMR